MGIDFGIDLIDVGMALSYDKVNMGIALRCNFFKFSASCNIFEYSLTIEVDLDIF